MGTNVLEDVFFWIKDFTWKKFVKPDILFDKESDSIKDIKPATRYDCKPGQELTRGTNKYFHWLSSRLSSICS